MARSARHLLACLAAAAACALPATAQTVTRSEAVAIGKTYVTHRWKAGPHHVRHGLDAAGIMVRTPDRAGGQATPAEEAWVVGEENTGVPYKWGGFDTIEKFESGLRRGRAAGDLYTAEKRSQGGAGVSAEAVGIDCSGFVSRCWKLPRKHSTSMLPSICRPLTTPAELLPGDVMNTTSGHVLLFVRWLDDQKSSALFYEAAPFSKTRAWPYDVSALAGAGFQPLRYRGIRD